MRASAALIATAVMLAAASPAAAQSLDYQYFKAKVEPVFLKKRPGHARCVVCHGPLTNNAFRLEKLPQGATFWTDPQSRKNFDTVSLLATPGNFDASKILKHPLAPEAGGDAFHSGGRQFASKQDPDWQILSQWVNGAKGSK
ncbi:MAG TPA: hypothetical protein VGB82_23730 [Alphaproteobacteria bacterium]